MRLKPIIETYYVTGFTQLLRLSFGRFLSCTHAAYSKLRAELNGRVLQLLEGTDVGILPGSVCELLNQLVVDLF